MFDSTSPEWLDRIPDHKCQVAFMPASRGGAPPHPPVCLMDEIFSTKGLFTDVD